MTLRPPASPAGRGWALSAFSAVALVALLAAYRWLAAPGQNLLADAGAGDAYYNLLIRGFRSGHLSLDAPVAPALLALPDPYDPGQNAPYRLLDASLYRGKYYLYFGPAPALLLYGPWHLLTGHYLSDAQAGWLAGSGGLLAGCALLAGIRRRYFPGIGAIAWIAALLAWGALTLVPLLLRRLGVWEVAIATGFAASALAALALFHAFHSRREQLWLACASAACGLAIAARPTYALGGLALLGPVWIAWRRPAGAGRDRGWRLAAAVVPAALIVAGLLTYNGLRFGNPLEFGERYQLSGTYESHLRHFSPSYLGFNLRAYLLAAAQLSPYFPFVRVPALPAAPPGHQGIEDPYGLLPNVPFLLLACAAVWACRQRPGLKAFLLSLVAGALPVAGVVLLFGLASNRYMVDFTPPIVIGSVIGFWQGTTRLTGWPGRAFRLTSAALLAWSLGFVFFASVRHNELLRQNQPRVYQRLAHVFGYPRYFLDRLAGRTYGPLELTVELPRRSEPGLEPLVVLGSEFLSDYLYLYYPTGDSLVVGFEHTGYGGPVTDPMPLDYRQPHRIRLDSAGLYPPAGDPYFDGWSPADLRLHTATLRVWLDGRPVLRTPEESYPAFRIPPAIGVAPPGQGAFGTRFTGRILGRQTLSPAAASDADPGAGGIVLTVEYPRDKSGGHEPLLVSGEPGRADVLVVNYLDPGHVSFTFDHWGEGGPTSAPVPVAPNHRQTLVIRFGSFFAPDLRPDRRSAAAWAEAATRLELIVDEREVFNRRSPFYPASPASLAVGRNTIGASSCTPDFTGRIFCWAREDPP
jgi:hypothetical protein